MRALFFLPFCIFANSLSISVDAPYVCMINANTGKVIYDKRMEEKVYPASVTKLATALYIAEECEVNNELIVRCSKEALRVVSEKQKVESGFSLPPYVLEDDGSSISLRANERISLKDLMYALLVRSANDSANVLAETYAETIPDFMFQLNKYLRTIGCKNTHFVNPHGLHHPNHYSTPHDLAIILKRAIGHKEIREVLSTAEYVIPKTNLSSQREIKNSNKLIRKESKHYYPAVVGGKTGYHWRAKRNIALYADNNKRSIIVVLNKAESVDSIFDDCKKALTTVFEEKIKNRVLFNAAESVFTNIYSWANKELLASLKDDVILHYYPSEEEEVEAKVNWREIGDPIHAGDVVATLDVYNKEGVPIMQRNIYANISVGHKFVYLVELTLNSGIKFLATYPKSFIFLLVSIILFFRRRRVKVV